MAYFNPDIVEEAHKEFSSHGALDEDGMYFIIPAYLNFVS